jgi:hypothetical protein
MRKKSAAEANDQRCELHVQYGILQDTCMKKTCRCSSGVDGNVEGEVGKRRAEGGKKASCP